MKTYQFFPTLILLIAFSNPLFSQNDSIAQADTLKMNQRVNVTMKNGDDFSGTIIKMDKEIIELKTANGIMQLIASNVKSIKPVDMNQRFSFANPHDTRYFFGPSAIPLEKGEGYYQNIFVLFNFANYGITENLSIGGGFEFLSTITGSPIWFLTPKLGFQVADNVYIGGGAIVAGFASEGFATLGYGAFTLGHADTNISLGVGYGIFEGEISDSPAIMLSGTHRVSNSISLLSENYLLSDVPYFGIQGIRLMSKKNSFDFGLIVSPAFFEEIPALPYVGYVRVF